MKLQKRDWALALLFVAIIGTNWAWYQGSKGQDLTNKNSAAYDIQLQSQINKLKACIDGDTKPCDTSPTR